MINFKKFLGILVLGMLLSSNALALTYDEAIKKFFDGRKLDPIEGVWTHKEGFVQAFVKEGSVYYRYMIEHKYDHIWPSGSKGEYPIRRAGGGKVYTDQTTIYNLSNINERATGGRTLLLDNINYITIVYDRGCWSSGRCWDGWESYYIRNWPHDFYAYNKKFEKKEEVKKKVERSKPKTQYKDYWWVVVLLGLLAFFLYVTTVKKSKIKIKSRTQKKDSEIKKILKPYWQGKVSYGYSFWIYLTLLNGVLSIPAIYLGYGLTDSDWNNMSDIALVGTYLYFIFLLAAKIYFIVGTWRSAENYKILKKRKKQGAAWAYIGQFYIILSIIRGVMMMVNEF